MKQAKQKKCKQCKSPFTPFNSMQKVCGAQCAQAFAVSEREKKEAKAKSDEVKRVRQKLKQLSMKDRPKALRAAREAFNAFIRYRDKDLPCISCQRHHQGQYHAGHYKTKGAHPELEFHEDNCHKQCAPCNNHLSGNIVNYRPNLVDKVGIEMTEWIEGPHETKKYTVDELWQIRDKYKAKLKELKALDSNI
jgi:hypothetical protein